MAETTEYRIKVIEKMFKILHTIEKENQPLGVNEIARKSELNAITTFRILKSLMTDGWVYQNRDEKYSPGYRLCSSYTMGKFFFILKDVSYCVMRSLTDQEDEVLNLSIRQNDLGVLLQQTKTSKFVDYVINVDSTFPLYATAGGKILLSEMPFELAHQLIGIMKFNKYTARTITDPDVLLCELETIRKQGYALDAGESLTNTWCIAVPVRGPANEIIAALSFSGLVGEITSEKKNHYVQLLQVAAKYISDQMFRLYKESLPIVEGFYGQAADQSGK